MKHPFSRTTKKPKQKHRLYYRWCNIIKKGAVCQEWSANYLVFLVWATQNGYKDGYYLTRKDKDKGFEPENCFWGEHKNSMEPSLA